MPSTADIAVFVRTIDLGTFAAVAEERGLTSSGVSRIVSRLEAQLGAKLIHRSTRRLVLTQEGETFLSHVRGILTAMEAAEADVASVHGQPRGSIRVNSGTAFAKHKLVPLLSDFTRDYPDITIDLSVNDRRIDPVADQVDVTIRVGPLTDNDLLRVRLGEVRRVIAASPAYLSRHGRPERPSDLLDHNCLQLTGLRRLKDWPMLENGKKLMLPVKGNLSSDSAEALLDMALAGLGIIRVGDFLGAAALAEGRLLPLLPHCHDDDPQPISALILPGRQSMPRVRCFVDFLKARIRPR